MNRFKFFFLSLGFSLLACILYFVAAFESLKSEDFVASWNLPPEADSLGIPLAAGYLISVIGIIIVLLIHVIILMLCFTRFKNCKINVGLLLPQRREIFMNFIRCIAILPMAYFAWGYLSIEFTIKDFFPFNLFFSIFAILSIAIFTIWFIATFQGQQASD